MLRLVLSKLYADGIQHTGRASVPGQCGISGGESKLQLHIDSESSLIGQAAFFYACGMDRKGGWKL